MESLTERKKKHMAQNVQIILTDDIDGSEATETIRFGLDGQQYEIDLNDANAEQLRDALNPYRSAARKVTTKAGPRSASRTPQGISGETAKIRKWAKDNGYEVSDRGRIHQHIKDAYRAAQNEN